MNFWLVKSEPDAFGWEQFVAEGVTAWTGVRNHGAKLNLKAMRPGDRAFFYHSQVGREIVGVAEVVREAYPDPTAGTGDWVCVDLRAVAAMPLPVSLAAMKADAALEGFALLRQSRLSVVPVSAEHWRHICALGGWRGK
jgi:predicted RNA-binding protein with PUA-like domain